VSEHTTISKSGEEDGVGQRSKKKKRKRKKKKKKKRKKNSKKTIKNDTILCGCFILSSPLAADLALTSGLRIAIYYPEKQERRPS
jgi:hypothetical protein